MDFSQVHGEIRYSCVNFAVAKDRSTSQIKSTGIRLSDYPLCSISSGLLCLWNVFGSRMTIAEARHSDCSIKEQVNWHGGNKRGQHFAAHGGRRMYGQIETEEDL
jgi:hypothetical protein